MKEEAIWRIALPLPLANYFDYLPCEHDAVPRPGCRVQVPFGARTLVGIFIESVHQSDVPTSKLKAAQAVLDHHPLLDGVLLTLCVWASGYYHHPLGEVVVNALPKTLRDGKALLTAAVKAPQPTSDEPLLLNQAQQVALNAILAKDGFAVSLLAGVTGSGKTEVYLQAIAAVLRRQKTALVLVPEINLTPQTIQRFEARFSVAIALMHSRLTDKQRATIWAQIYGGEIAIVIGTRSAVFAPLTNLGIIIVDEEHDASFKSQKQLRYSARDLAIMRAQLTNIPVVLGSATPSLESYYNARRGRYQLLSLLTRAGHAKLPRIDVINLCQQEMQSGLSAPLIAAIRKHLAANKQVLLFLNRRGYAPVMMCHHCGYSVSCDRCDVKMTFHRSSSRLVCHHCDKTLRPPRVCPECQQSDLMTLGQGTEQIEEVLQALFPDQHILRIDRDTTSTQKKLHEKLEKINSGHANILIGTQMLAKGHHFPHLGLSAILDVDSGFFSLDFRAIERLAQLIVQVAGRAGRSETVGQVIIQTHHPEHHYLTLLLQQGYFALIDQLLIERKNALLPPFSFQAVIWAQAIKQQPPVTFLEAAADLCRQAGVTVFGPMPALLERRAGQFRYLLILQSSSRNTLKKCLQLLRPQLEKIPAARAVRWVIDVDPLETC